MVILDAKRPLTFMKRQLRDTAWYIEKPRLNSEKVEMIPFVMQRCKKRYFLTKLRNKSYRILEADFVIAESESVDEINTDWNEIYNRIVRGTFNMPIGGQVDEDDNPLPAGGGAHQPYHPPPQHQQQPQQSYQPHPSGYPPQQQQHQPQQYYAPPQPQRSPQPSYGQAPQQQYHAPPQQQQQRLSPQPQQLQQQRPPQQQQQPPPQAQQQAPPQQQKGPQKYMTWDDMIE
eukprot:TRINITY_DN4633_c0_g1_i5.p1 TRINITY_DN4633_c0_g1~~TRINITY_DN4633_c0_g1_i5.p1  ORF type:complete len:264 (-),score=98.22 TRINITY_DN4633_c0_g1_i5:123-812(-)